MNILIKTLELKSSLLCSFFCKQKGVSVPVLRTPLMVLRKRNLKPNLWKPVVTLKQAPEHKLTGEKVQTHLKILDPEKNKKRSKIQNIPPVNSDPPSTTKRRVSIFIKKMKMKMNWRKRLSNGMYQTKLCQRSEKGKLWKTKTLNGNKYMPLEQSHQEIDQQISMPLKPKGEAK